MEPSKGRMKEKIFPGLVNGVRSSYSESRARSAAGELAGMSGLDWSRGVFPFDPDILPPGKWGAESPGSAPEVAPGGCGRKP